MHEPRLESDRVTLAPPWLESAAGYARRFGDPAVTRYLEWLGRRDDDVAPRGAFSGSSQEVALDYMMYPHGDED
jgi:hypothetical protein